MLMMCWSLNYGACYSEDMDWWLLWNELGHSWKPVVPCCAGAPWSDNASTEWLNSVLLELYRYGKLPKKSAADDRARIGGRQGADRPVEHTNGAASEQLAEVK